MQCTLLGSGYSITTARRHNTSLFLQDGARALLVDCNGMCVQRLIAAGFAFETLEHIFLTHQHIDHVAGLVSLMHQIWLKSCYYRTENKRIAPMHFYANAATLKVVQNLFEAAGLPDSPHLFLLEFHTLPDDGGAVTINGFAMNFFPVRHSAPCLGFAVAGAQGTLVYSADTEPVPAIYGWLKKGDTLIHECNDVHAPLNAGHTTWPQLRDIIPKLPPVKTYLVHLPAMKDEEEAALSKALADAGTVQLGEDGITIVV